MNAEAYSGFPAEGLRFMRELAANNTKEWFADRKEEYRAVVQEPSVSLVKALGSRIRAEFPPVTFDTRTNGGSLMRIHRDVRFSSDKRPYKTNIAMMFAPASARKMEAPGFGLQITLEEVQLVGGQFRFLPEQLERYRAAVVTDRSGKPFQDIVDAVRGATGYRIGEADLKRVPRGYPAEHPRADLLRHKGFAVYTPPISLATLTSPGFIDEAIETLRVTATVVRWLNDHIG